MANKIFNGVQKAVAKKTPTTAQAMMRTTGPSTLDVISGKTGGQGQQIAPGVTNTAPPASIARPTAASPAPYRPKAKSAPVPSGGGGGGAMARSVSGGGGSYGSTATGVAAPMDVPAAAPQLSEDEWRAQDSTYLGEESSLQLELQKALAGLRDQRTNYQSDFGKSARNLGWSWQDQNNDGLPDDNELQAGSWDRDNQQGAYGQAYKNQTDDFVGRGLMDSTFYADANKELDRGFTRQYDDMSGARANYLKQLASEETGAQDTNTAAIQRARAEASARRAATYGL